MATSKRVVPFPVPVPVTSLGKVGELTLVVQRRSAGWVNNTQAQIQGFNLAQSSIYPIYEMVKCMKERSCRIKAAGSAKAQGNNRIYERLPTEDSVAEDSLEQTNDSLQ